MHIQSAKKSNEPAHPNYSPEKIVMFIGTLPVTSINVALARTDFNKI